MQMNPNTIVRHHLLELILWPNGDGTFREIVNSSERLKELGIYNDFKLTIEITCLEHNRLHRKGRPAYNRGIPSTKEARLKNSLAHIGREPGNKGKKGIYSHNADIRARISEKMKGRCKHNTGKHWKLVNGVRTWY